MDSNVTLKDRAEQSREILGARINESHELRPHLLALLEYIDHLKAECYNLEYEIELMDDYEGEKL